MKTKTLCLLLGIIIIVSCGKSAPKGDSPEVKSLLISIIGDKLTEQIQNNDRKPFNIIDLSNEIVHVAIQKYETFKIENNYISSEPWFGADSAYRGIKHQVTDSICNELKKNIRIENIRLVSKDDKIRKCECEADFYNGDQKVQTFSFFAQYTEENKLYVEVEL